MKIRTEREPLAEALAWVTRVISKNPQAPALAGVKIAAGEDLIQPSGIVNVSAFDFDTSHAAALVADVTGGGECLVSGLFLRDAVAGGRGAEVELVLDGDALTVTSGRSVYRLRTMKLLDYPELPPFPPVVGIVNPDRLRDALAAVVPAVDDASPVDKVRGVHLEAEVDALEIVGTDIYRIHRTSTFWDGQTPFEATVPSRALSAAVKAMSEAVEIGCDGSRLGLSDGTHRVTTRCFTTPYPPIQRAVEKAMVATPDHFTVDRDDLAAAVKQGGAMAGEAPLILTYEDGEVSIAVDSESGDGCEVLAATGDGPPLRASINPRYMTDLLAACLPGQVAVHYASGVVAPLIVVDPQQSQLDLVLMTKRLGGNPQ